MSETFDFSEALRRLKGGKRLERAGWNGRGMWISLVEFWAVHHGRNPHQVLNTEDIPKQNAEWAYELSQLGFNEESFLAFIGMKTADNKFVPWLASQSDLLSEDWSEVD